MENSFEGYKTNISPNYVVKMYQLQHEVHTKLQNGHQNEQLNHYKNHKCSKKLMASRVIINLTIAKLDFQCFQIQKGTHTEIQNNC